MKKRILSTIFASTLIINAVSSSCHALVPTRGGATANNDNNRATQHQNPFLNFNNVPPIINDVFTGDPAEIGRRLIRPSRPPRTAPMQVDDVNAQPQLLIF